MKIAIYGASGMIGSRIAAEAVRRGHDVLGVTRSGGDVPAGARPVQGSANDVATVKEIAGTVDAVVSAIGPSRTGGDHQDFLDAIANLAAAGPRLLVVGGAGSLLVNGGRLVDSPEMPEIYKAESLTAARSLEYLRGTDESVAWTYFSPAMTIEPGERTGTFRLGLDEPVGTEISAEDYAVALLDEIETPKHHRARFTIGY